MPSIILEASKYQKKYKCPYCNHRDTRANLVSHINKDHIDMIPKDYTATRVVFNMINKKEHGSCIICRGETKWDEDKARYDRICGKKSCHDKYVNIAHTNTDIENKMRDPEFQQKMLAGRSISGKYKFSDGGFVSYTGSYEKQLLEFLDKFLKVKSYDIQSPGPTIEYEYDGKKHFWITDQYYIPYNLVFDVKDGGDNPNRREMNSYREKQIAKEKAIAKQGKYNYIRLTNNNFEQLIDIMLELKDSFDPNEKTKKPVIRINENTTMALNTIPPANAKNIYIIDYLKRNTFSENDDEHHYAVCKDYMQDAVTVKNGIFDMISFEELKEMNVSLYEYTGNDIDYIDLLESVENDKDFYKILTGKDLLDPNQFQFDSLFKKVTPYTEELEITKDAIKTSMMAETNSPILVEGMNMEFPYFELERYNEEFSPVKYYRDIHGIFMMNEDTKFRTKSYPDISYLQENHDIIIKILSNNNVIPK